jgi:hypothetical protein
MNNDPVPLDDYQDMKERAERAEAEVKRLRAALETYADKANWLCRCASEWHDCCEEEDHCCFDDFQVPDEFLHGYDIARCVLGLDTTEGDERKTT